MTQYFSSLKKFVHITYLSAPTEPYGSPSVEVCKASTEPPSASQAFEWTYQVGP